jgi:ABC-type transport system involved in cytochrome bd biosynthesis fused ATPase/permease subunit
MMQDRGILWVLGRAQMAEQFDAVMVMERGKLIDKGSFAEMKNSSEHFQQLLAAE